MPRQQGIAIENSFTKGLITENTALNFPRNAATEQDNCVFDEKGRVTRRPGIDYENNYTLSDSLAFDDGEAYSEYVWDQVNGLGTVSFLVQQQGSTLHFYNISLTTNLSPNKLASTIDLDDYTADDTSLDPGAHSCGFAQGNGDLIVVNRACDPFYINYDENTGTLSATEITIKYRDFEGVTPESAVTTDATRLTATTAQLKTTYPNHLYNLVNQGWWQGGITSGMSDALTQWDTARSDMPSNMDQVSFYRSSATDPFDASRVTGNGPGSTLAPKGHFILRLGDADRAAAYTDEGFTLDVSTTTITYPTVDRTLGTRIGNFTNDDNAFDGSFSASNYSYRRGSAESQLNAVANSSTTPAGSGWIGKDFGLSVTKNISSVEVSNSIIQYVANFEQDGASATGTEMSLVVDTDIDVTFRVYASNSSPSNETDGTIIGTAVSRSKAVNNDTVFLRGFIPSGSNEGDPGDITIDETLWGQSSTLNIDSAGDREFNTKYTLGQGTTTISCNDTTAYRYVWLQTEFDGLFRPTMKEFTSPDTMTNCKTDTASHNVECRVHELRFIEKKTVTSSTSGSLGDPDVTSERPTVVEFFAGRVWYGGVQANNLGNNIYFSQIIEKPNQYGRCYQRYDPTSDTFFDLLPTDGGVIKIPEMGRVVKLFNYQTSLLVFATNGVWIIRGGNGGFTATDFYVRKLSSAGSQSPLSFVDVEGFPIWWGEDGIFVIEYNPQFDSFTVNSLTDDTIRSFYTAIPTNLRKYAKGCYDFVENVVYWIYADGTNSLDEYDYDRVLAFNLKSKAFYSWTIGTSTPVIKGVAYINDSIGDSDPKIVFTTTVDVDASNTKITYSDFKTNVYADWVTYDDTGVAFDSYFVTGYMVDGETQRFIQGMYVFFFMDYTLTTSSAYVQGIYDFTTSGDSGKWSTPQQIYNTSLSHRSISQTRRKIRGKGRCLQLRVTSDGTAPFSIVGWSVNETSNANI